MIGRATPSPGAAITCATLALRRRNASSLRWAPKEETMSKRLKSTMIALFAMCLVPVFASLEPGGSTGAVMLDSGRGSGSYLEPVAAPAPAPTMLARAVLSDQRAAAGFDLIHFVIDFAPGAWTPVHMHGGVMMLTVLEGVVTHRYADGSESTFTVGEGWIEQPGVYGAAGNDGRVAARIMVSALLPEGATLTTLRE
jgi:quercetin dioxygenase-like cupin family protein